MRITTVNPAPRLAISHPNLNHSFRIINRVFCLTAILMSCLLDIPLACYAIMKDSIKMKCSKKIAIFCFFLFSLLLPSLSFSGTLYSVASGPWSSASTWASSSGGAPGAGVPDNGDDVIIERGFNVTVDLSTTTANSVQIGGSAIGNGTLTFAAGSQLAVDNSVTLGNGTRTGSLDFTNGGILQIGINGTGTLVVVTLGTFTPGTGTISYIDNAAQVVATTASLGAPYNNLTLASSGIKTTTGVTVNGILSIEGTATASVAPTYGTNAGLQYNTTTARTASVEWITPFTGLSGVTIANTGAITMDAAKVLDTGVRLKINDNSTLVTNNFQLTLSGDFIRDLGIITAGSSPVNITGTAPVQLISGITTTGALSFTKSSGTATLTGDISASSLTMNGVGGTLNLGVGLTHTITGAWTRTAGTIEGNQSTIKFGGAFSGTGGSFNAQSGTVEWNATGAQTIADLSYNNLIVSGSGVKTVVLSNPISNDFTIGGSASVSLATALTVNGILKTTSTGSLTLGALNLISNTTPITLDGGTFSTGNPTGFNETVGTLKVTNHSTIVLGTSVHSLNFAASQGNAWTVGKVLTIWGIS